MKRSLVPVAFGLLVLATVAGAATAAMPFVHGPYSGAPSATSVVISWVLSFPSPAELEVAPEDATTTTEPFPRILDVAAASEGSHGQVHVLVDGLEPATAYVYRVVIQSGPEIASSPIGRFKTEPAPGQTVTFAVLSDTQWQWEGTNRLAVIGDTIAFDAARSGGFDFVLHAGDLVETPNAFYWDPWFTSFESMLLAAPFVPVLGNHEKNSVSYYNAFAHPSGGGQGDERWWALHWGDVVVVGLDTNADRADRILEQQAYARAELSGPERWKFVIFHHPVYSSDAYHGSGYGYETIYHPIFVETGVDIVFNGHAHNYERIEKDGIVYLVLGGGGAVPRELAPTRVDGSVVAIENHSFYAHVSAAPDKISVDIVSVAEATETTFVPTPGELLDSFTLTASGEPSVSSAAELPLPDKTQTASASLAPVATVSSVETQTSSQMSAVPEVASGRETQPAAAAPTQTQDECVMPSIAGLIALLALLAIAAWALLRAGN